MTPATSYTLPPPLNTFDTGQNQPSAATFQSTQLNTSSATPARGVDTYIQDRDIFMRYLGSGVGHYQVNVPDEDPEESAQQYGDVPENADVPNTLNSPPLTDDTQNSDNDEDSEAEEEQEIEENSDGENSEDEDSEEEYEEEDNHQQLGPEDGENNFDDTAVQMGHQSHQMPGDFAPANRTDPNLFVSLLRWMRTKSVTSKSQPNGSQVYGMELARMLVWVGQRTYITKSHCCFPPHKMSPSFTSWMRDPRLVSVAWRARRIETATFEMRVEFGGGEFRVNALLFLPKQFSILITAVSQPIRSRGNGHHVHHSVQYNYPYLPPP
ncbi:hypothetical protein DFH08DRAFT_936976 [Mycena albidolilacea]|uniref:Uncharacterized protein n=1 Tax=Mycena albidolilacea TaxID=1033008 RepID=A0AAD7A2F1_9AGAR|nr:hypothetical protein DFH08DRAFT_936976 [Mycena albidolilacea]